MDFKQMITEARSCRRFDGQKAVSAEDFEWLVDCARLVPCARNQQALRYVVVNSEAGCEVMRNSLIWAGSLRDWNGPEKEEHPAGYIVICVEEGAGKLVHIDTGIAGQTLQLAAQSRGLSACMFLSCDPAKVRTLLDLPSPWGVGLVVAVGYAGEKRVIANVPESGKLEYWRDEQSTHHVPKLQFSQIFFGYK